MSTAKVDSGASIGRAQLAERMRRMIFNATGVDSKGITSSELQINEQHSVETSADYEVAPATEVSISNDALPLSNETLPSSNETLPIYPKDQGDETTQVSNDSLPSNVSTGNVPLLGNDLYGNDSLPSNDSSGNVPLPSNDSSPNFSGNVPLPSNDSLPKNTQETGNGTLPDNGSLPKNTPETGNKTLPSNDSLPYWSDISPYGEPISEELFLLVLDAGMVELRASILGDSESVSMLFYWLITRQRRSILYLTYAKMVEDFNYTKPKLSRALDKFREHPLFSVKATHKGVFISIQRLLDRIKQTYPQFDHTDSNESLPPVSSSNNIYIYNQKKITTTTSNESLLPLCSLTDIDFHVLVDLITFYGFGPKEISLKVTETIATIYNVYGLEKIAFNLAYASGNKKVTSPIAYLLKTFSEDYGSSSLSLDDINKSKEIIETLRLSRDKSLDEHSASELRRFLFILGKPIPEGSTRQQCLSEIVTILSKSDDLYQKMSQIIGRDEKRKPPYKFTRN